MSILIKGMEMPKAGNWKTVRIYYDGTCAEPNWQGDCSYMQGCEAVLVPPHGKLIDADTLEVKDGWLDNQDGTQTHIQFVYANDIINASTIIEAEEGKR